MPIKSVIRTTIERVHMNTCKFTLAALLLGAAGACAARVPVIQLKPLMRDGASHAGAAAQPLVPVALLSPGGPEQRRQSAGSFAGAAASVLALPAGAALMPPTARTRFGALVAARPLPPFGPVLLLVLGCLVYLGRGRQRGFSLRPAHSLIERSFDAPARA